MRVEKGSKGINLSTGGRETQGSLNKTILKRERKSDVFCFEQYLTLKASECMEMQLKELCLIV